MATRIDAALPSSITHAVAAPGNVASAHASTARTASVAKPRPCDHVANTQPVSRAVIGGSISRLKSASPTSPAKRPLARSVTTQKP